VVLQNDGKFEGKITVKQGDKTLDVPVSATAIVL
jgi:hypothetical protein